MGDANPVLVTSTRSDLVEVRHRGAVVVVRSTGESLLELGDCDNVTYPRSALKFVQVLPFLESGAADRFGVIPAELALMCASHNGEPMHVAAAQSILDRAGLSERHLRCGTHAPMCSRVHEEILRSGGKVSELHNNCSGKHAGFLALAQHLGTDLDTYLALDHPVQQRIRAAVCDVYQTTEEALHVGCDGCTAPNYAMPLRQMALGFARLCDPTVSWSPERAASIAKMRQSILAHPEMVAGPSRFCTQLMSAMAGAVIGKLGAAGVYCLGVPGQGIGVAIKIDDGETGPQYAVAVRLLEKLNIGTPDQRGALSRFAEIPVLNCRGETVGISKTVADKL